MMPQFDLTPDQPEQFGFKVSWFAVKAVDPVAVLDTFGLKEASPSNWASGLAAAHARPTDDEKWVFVSPSVDGWILAVSRWWVYPTVETHHDIGARFDALFSRLMKRFDDVQFFGSERVSDFSAWARALNGAPARIFAWTGSEGQVLMNFGDQTPEEAELRFANLTGLSPDEAGEEIFRMAEEDDTSRAFPEEEAVVDLAALWSVDPTKLPEQDLPPGLGWAVRLPKDLSQ